MRGPGLSRNSKLRPGHVRPLVCPRTQLSRLDSTAVGGSPQWAAPEAEPNFSPSPDQVLGLRIAVEVAGAL